MTEHDSISPQESTAITARVAEAVAVFQSKITGHTPRAVTVVMSEDTLVITMQEALTPAERELAKTVDGVAQVREFHRQLFATSSESLRHEIQQITGRVVREATAEVEPSTGAIVQAFTTGTMVQIFLLEPRMPSVD